MVTPLSRLFAFGCSFTNYYWSTWADCLAPEFDEFHNWGQIGAGNHYIFNSVMEADQRHNFAKGDTVVVCWTHVLREDRYIKNKWTTLSPATAHKVYTKEFIASLVDERGYLLRDLAYIKATKALLESKPDVNWKFLSICPITMIDWTDEQLTEHSDASALYKNVIDSIQYPDYKSFLSESQRDLYENDPHPTPQEHLMYLDAILPGWVTKEETRVKMSIELKNKQLRRNGLSTVTRL